MTTYFVGTLARYVLVDANDEAEAREVGQPALHELYVDVRDPRPPRRTAPSGPAVAQQVCRV
jgi:hypothetical protein